MEEKKILIIEDNELNRKLILSLLEIGNYIVNGDILYGLGPAKFRRGMARMAGTSGGWLFPLGIRSPAVGSREERHVENGTSRDGACFPDCLGGSDFRGLGKRGRQFEIPPQPRSRLRKNSLVKNRFGFGV